MISSTCKEDESGMERRLQTRQQPGPRLGQEMMGPDPAGSGDKVGEQEDFAEEVCPRHANRWIMEKEGPCRTGGFWFRVGTDVG